MKRRSSILKPPKTRNPLSDLDMKKNAVEDTTEGTTVDRNKRVSFSHTQGIALFRKTEHGNTIWDNFFEEMHKVNLSEEQSPRLDDFENMKRDILDDINNERSPERLDRISDMIAQFSNPSLVDPTEMLLNYRTPHRANTSANDDSEMSLTQTLSVPVEDTAASVKSKARAPFVHSLVFVRADADEWIRDKENIQLTPDEHLENVHENVPKDPQADVRQHQPENIISGQAFSTPRTAGEKNVEMLLFEDMSTIMSFAPTAHSKGAGNKNFSIRDPALDISRRDVHMNAKKITENNDIRESYISATKADPFDIEKIKSSPFEEYTTAKNGNHIKHLQNVIDGKLEKRETLERFDHKSMITETHMRLNTEEFSGRQPSFNPNSYFKKKDGLENTKTLIFDRRNKDSEMSMTAVVSSLDYDKGEKRETLLFDRKSKDNREENSKTSICEGKSDDCNMSMTTAVPAVVRDNGEKRKTLIFDGKSKDCEMSMTTAVPAVIYDKGEKRKTLIFDGNSDNCNMSMTTAVPVVIHDKEDKRKTMIFDGKSDDCNMSMTNAVSTVLYDQEEKRKTFIFDGKSDYCNMSITTAVPAVIYDKGEKKKTPIFDGKFKDRDISMTTAVSAALNDKGVKRKTLIFDGKSKDSDMSMTAAVSSEFPNSDERRKTLIFDGITDDCDMSMTAALIAVPAVIQDKEDKRKTLIFDGISKDCDMSMTSIVSSVFQNNEEKQKSLFYGGLFDDSGMSMTFSIPKSTPPSLETKSPIRLKNNDEENSMSNTRADLMGIQGQEDKRNTLPINFEFTQNVSLKSEILEKQDQKAIDCQNNYSKVDLSAKEEIISSSSRMQEGTENLFLGGKLKNNITSSFADDELIGETNKTVPFDCHYKSTNLSTAAMVSCIFSEEEFYKRQETSKVFPDALRENESINVNKILVEDATNPSTSVSSIKLNSKEMDEKRKNNFDSVCPQSNMSRVEIEKNIFSEKPENLHEVNKVVEDCMNMSIDYMEDCHGKSFKTNIEPPFVNCPADVVNSIHLSMDMDVDEYEHISIHQQDPLSKLCDETKTKSLENTSTQNLSHSVVFKNNSQKENTLNKSIEFVDCGVSQKEQAENSFLNKSSDTMLWNNGDKLSNSEKLYDSMEVIDEKLVEKICESEKTETICIQNITKACVISSIDQTNNKYENLTFSEITTGDKTGNFEISFPALNTTTMRKKSMIDDDIFQESIMDKEDLINKMTTNIPENMQAEENTVNESNCDFEDNNKVYNTFDQRAEDKPTDKSMNDFLEQCKSIDLNSVEEIINAHVDDVVPEEKHIHSENIPNLTQAENMTLDNKERSIQKKRKYFRDGFKCDSFLNSPQSKCKKSNIQICSWLKDFKNNLNFNELAREEKVSDSEQTIKETDIIIHKDIGETKLFLEDISNISLVNISYDHVKNQKQIDCLKDEKWTDYIFNEIKKFKFPKNDCVEESISNTEWSFLLFDQMLRIRIQFQKESPVDSNTPISRISFDYLENSFTKVFVNTKVLYIALKNYVNPQYLLSKYTKWNDIPNLLRLCVDTVNTMGRWMRNLEFLYLRFGLKCKKDRFTVKMTNHHLLCTWKVDIMTNNIPFTKIQDLSVDLIKGETLIDLEKHLSTLVDGTEKDWSFMKSFLENLNSHIKHIHLRN